MISLQSQIINAYVLPAAAVYGIDASVHSAKRLLRKPNIPYT